VSFSQLATYATSLFFPLKTKTQHKILSHFFSKSLFTFHLSTVSNPNISFSLSTSLPYQTLLSLSHFFFQSYSPYSSLKLYAFLTPRSSLKPYKMCILYCIIGFHLSSTHLKPFSILNLKCCFSSFQ